MMIIRKLKKDFKVTKFDDFYHNFIIIFYKSNLFYMFFMDFDNNKCKISFLKPSILRYYFRSTSMQI